MKASDALTLEACLLALVNAEVELPPDRQAAVQSLGTTLPAQDSETIAQLRELIIGHPDLKPQYDRARRTLQAQYQTQERTKSALGVAALNLGDLNGSGGDLFNLAATLLTAEDIRAATRRLFQGKDTRRIYQQTAPELRPFLQTLAAAVTRLDPTAVALMRELDRNPTTWESLGFHLHLSPYRTQTLVRRLQREGYICPLNGNLFNFVLPLFGVYPQRSQSFDENTAFCLTAKGYFHLNPVISTHPITA